MAIVSPRLKIAPATRWSTECCGGGSTHMGQRRPGNSRTGSRGQGRMGMAPQPAGRPSARRRGWRTLLVALVDMPPRWLAGRMRKTAESGCQPFAGAMADDAARCQASLRAGERELQQQGALQRQKIVVGDQVKQGPAVGAPAHRNPLEILAGRRPAELGERARRSGPPCRTCSTSSPTRRLAKPPSSREKRRSTI